MASRKLDFKSAPSFDIEHEQHLFDEWHLMWMSFEVLSGLADISDLTVKKSMRMHALRTAFSKETLKVVMHLPFDALRKWMILMRFRKLLNRKFMAQ